MSRWVIALGFLYCFSSALATPVHLDSMRNQLIHGEEEAWSPPEYENQQGKIGYDPDDFKTPKRLSRQVQFWIEIYSKYDSDTGVIHDSEHIDAIYEVVKFPEVKGSVRQKNEILRQRKRLVDDAKKRAQQRLERLHDWVIKRKNPNKLSARDRDIWNKFLSERDKNKFKRAKSKSRLRMQLGQKDQFRLAIYYSGRYLQDIESIFEKHNLPKELTRLPFVESSFNILAQSKVGASGIWQFMRFAARPLLHMDRIVDHRNDPIRSSEAAAIMLKSNYKMLQRWQLAITAYNYGASGMKRLSKKFGTKDMTRLILKAEHRRFGFASKNFYPSFLAALKVEQRADTFFNKPTRAVRLQRAPLKVDRPLGWDHLLELFSGNEKIAKIFNPFLTHRIRQGKRKIPAGYSVFILPSSKARAEKLIAKLPKKEEIRKYRVRRGDTLSEIAERFGISVRNIKSYNGLRSANRIHIGQVIDIPN